MSPHHPIGSKLTLPQELPPLLRKLVRESVSTLGEVLRIELEAPLFLVIESIRTRMSSLRWDSKSAEGPILSKTLSELSTLSASDRLRIASAYTLMLELMNACENAYRTFRLSQQSPLSPGPFPEAIVYVVTAHPTEARAPKNINIFYRIQNYLTEVLKRQGSVLDQSAQELRHLLAIAWRTAIVRERKPTVRDECEHIYSILLREETLKSILDLHEQLVPFYLRSWVGGDKDGHPGVDERALRQSLGLSRRHLLVFVDSRLKQIIREAQDLPSARLKMREMNSLISSLRKAQSHLRSMRVLASSDGRRARVLRTHLQHINELYLECFGIQHPDLRRILNLLRVFPGLVIPLELRESSDILMTYPKKKNLPIVRMVAQIGKLAKGGDPRWYARGFIISMAESFEHIQKAAQIVSEQLGAIRIPIVPLFEQEDALRNANSIISRTLKDSTLKKAARLYWSGSMEIMVGYSDSAKEAGVFRSRLLIAQTMTELEKTCKRARVKPIFFHGSGGSVDRGGGSIQDQASWWPDGALRLHKATLQGEMVERSFASPEIMRSQLQKIVESSGSLFKRGGRGDVATQTLLEFSKRVATAYQKRVSSPDFLQMIQAATPYPYLSILRLGSRPSKRGKFSSVRSLRAIPWVLCWTQTRVLFPSWWGIGTAWKNLSQAQRRSLQKEFSQNAFFRSYIKALGFTLAKVELPIWGIYLKRRLSPAIADRLLGEFEEELVQASAFLHSISGEDQPLWFRPWLATSIRLRAPMIHPLNLLQILALESGDRALLRVTVTGIASGMMTTG